MTVIVGAGLAGLACAHELCRSGRACLVVEAADAPGGRVRSDTLDGFTLDRGFQVILTSYSAVKRVVDIRALAPRFFARGALLWDGSQMLRIESPLNSPRSLISGAFTPVFPLPDKLRLARELATVLATPDSRLLAGCASADDVSVAAWLEARGFSEVFVERFARPFFGGVLLDNTLGTSAALFRYYLKKFATGRAWIPAIGIGAFPAAIADSLPAGTVQYGRRVTSLVRTGGRVSALALEDGSEFPVSHVVLAVDEPALRRLTGGTPRPARPVSVAYFKSPRSLYDGAFLVLPSGANRLVRHFAQVTNVAPELAPRGWHLISATVLDPPDSDDATTAAAAADEIAAIFPDASLTHLGTTHVDYAVPAQPPGFAALTAPPRDLPQNVFTAGDWTSGASIQAAIESGLAAAARCP